MKFEDIKTASLNEVNDRLAEIKKNLDSATDLDALEKEIDALHDRKEAIAKEVERKKSITQKILQNPSAVVESYESVNPAKKTFGVDSKEYCSAFLKNLRGDRLNDIEQKTLATGITGNTSGTATDVSGQSILVPTVIADGIWDLVSKRHSILDDINVLKTGTVIEIVRHTASSGASIVAEGTAPSEETNTFAKITLAGKDFSKYIDLTYAMERMSIPSLQSYLITEVGTAIGDEMATDTVNTIIAQTNANNKSTREADATYTDVVGLFGALENADDVVVYAKRKTIYTQLVGMVGEDGHPIFQLDPTGGAVGYILGAPVKVEDAVPDKGLLIGDPSKVTMNVIQDVMIESDRDVKTHTTTIAGYARAESGLVADKAFSYSVQ